MNSPGTKFQLPYTGSTSLSGKISILNISTTSPPTVMASSANDAFLVFSDAPENVDQDVLSTTQPTALYMDQSGKIVGDCRVLMFHNNHLNETSGVWFGVTIYNPNSYPCELRLRNRSNSAASVTSGAGNGISVLEGGSSTERVRGGASRGGRGMPRNSAGPGGWWRVQVRVAGEA